MATSVNTNSSTYEEHAFNHNMNIRYSHGPNLFSISYRDNQLTNFYSLDSCNAPISIFGSIKAIPVNIKYIKISLYYIADFITNRKLQSGIEKEYLLIVGFGQAT